MTKGKQKGSAWERNICKQLSIWWSNSKRDDVFWRTASSGGRATQRKGKKTFGQYGDVQATDPIGQPLIDLCTIEIKVGYGNSSFFDLIDKLPSETKQPYKKFIQQIHNDTKKAGSEFWMLITKRDRKETLITIPIRLKRKLKAHSRSGIAEACPAIMFRCMLETDDKRLKSNQVKLFTTTLNQFLLLVRSSDIKAIINSE